MTSHEDRREDLLLGDDDLREWLEVVGTVGSRFKGVKEEKERENKN